MRGKIEIENNNINCAGIYGIKLQGYLNYLYIDTALNISDEISKHTYCLKNNLYSRTDKDIVQHFYNEGYNLKIEVLKESCHDTVAEMTIKEKVNLFRALKVLENNEKYFNDVIR